jgi:hypothetical protein
MKTKMTKEERLLRRVIRHIEDMRNSIDDIKKKLETVSEKNSYWDDFITYDTTKDFSQNTANVCQHAWQPMANLQSTSGNVVYKCVYCNVYNTVA